MPEEDQIKCHDGLPESLVTSHRAGSRLEAGQSQVAGLPDGLALRVGRVKEVVLRLLGHGGLQAAGVREDRPGLHLPGGGSHPR